MRFTIFSAAAIFSVVLVLTACNSTDRSVSSSTRPSAPPAASAAPNDGVRRITTTELRDLLDKGQAVVIDVRNQASYDAGHIHGAKLIPATDILARVNELPRDKMIVTYCS